MTGRLEPLVKALTALKAFSPGPATVPRLHRQQAPQPCAAHWRAPHQLAPRGASYQRASQRHCCQAETLRSQSPLRTMEVDEVAEKMDKMERLVMVRLTRGRRARSRWAHQKLTARDLLARPAVDLRFCSVYTAKPSWATPARCGPCTESCASWCSKVRPLSSSLLSSLLAHL